MQTRWCNLAVLTVALTGLAADARAQSGVSSGCAGQLSISRDACQKAADLFAFMAPQLGVSITGGNAVLGTASPLGGLGHFSIGVRANVVRGQVPQTDQVQLNLTGARSSNFAPQSKIVGLPTAEAAIGLFKGVTVGLTNIGGVDALVSAFYVPDIDEDRVSVSTTGGKLQLGYGVRVGILQETAFVPGVSVSYLRRDLPTVNLRAAVGTADSVAVTGLSEHTSAWRLAASKRFVIVGLTAGAGQDRYDSHADAQAYVAPRGVIPAVNAKFGGILAQKLTRTNVFAGASVDLALLRIAAEVGRVSGGDIAASYNTFGGRHADDAYTYASIGLRVGF